MPADEYQMLLKDGGDNLQKSWDSLSSDSNKALQHSA